MLLYQTESINRERGRHEIPQSGVRCERDGGEWGPGCWRRKILREWLHVRPRGHLCREDKAQRLWETKPTKGLDPMGNRVTN